MMQAILTMLTLPEEKLALLKSNRAAPGLSAEPRLPAITGAHPAVRDPQTTQTLKALQKKAGKAADGSENIQNIRPAEENGNRVYVVTVHTDFPRRTFREWFKELKQGLNDYAGDRWEVEGSTLHQVSGPGRLG